MDVFLLLTLATLLIIGFVYFLQWAFRRDAEARKAEKEKQREEEMQARQLVDELDEWIRKEST